MRTKEQDHAAHTDPRPSHVAAMLGCSRGHVLDRVRAGALQAINIGLGSRPEYRISKATVEAFLQKPRVQATTREGQAEPAGE